MLRRETLEPRSSMWDFLASHLHFLRMKHDYSCAYVGKITKAARQTVSHWESGYRKPDEKQVALLDELYGTGQLLATILYWAKAGHEANWYEEQVALEAIASEIRIYESGLVPGIFQTESYARTLFRQAGAADVEAEVRKRMARAEILTRSDPPRVWALLDENAVDRKVGGADVMREQLHRLLELSEYPNVILNVVPRSVGYHLGLQGSLKLLTVGRRIFAYTEAAAGGRLMQDPAEVEQMRLRHDLIAADALSRQASRDFIREIRESMA
ncbi:helix-turn-helix transcriptional regulator [Actinomadura sp. NTSP31]|uniref:helix-turn-helix domain-containing protein n=1 Tax=Actinomadura sp. NTSP31 TaxID=1735447 RepID=UPI0035C19B30